MQRLHARNHAKLAEAWNVGRIRIFNMLDAVTRIGSVIGSVGSFITVQRHPDCLVSYRVGEYLKVELV